MGLFAIRGQVGETLARVRAETRPALSRIRATGRLHTYVHEASAARYECAISSRAELPPF